MIQNINVIHPGESAEVDVHVRASGGGKHELYLLFRYESHKDDGGNKLLGKQKHRYVKKVVPIAVFPSLNLSASLMPSYWEKNEHVLSVEVCMFLPVEVDYFLYMSLSWLCCHFVDDSDSWYEIYLLVLDDELSK